MAYVDNVTVCCHEETYHYYNVDNFLKAERKYNLKFNEDKSNIKARDIQILGFEVSKGQIKSDFQRLQPLKDLQTSQKKKAQE